MENSLQVVSNTDEGAFAPVAAERVRLLFRPADLGDLQAATALAADFANDIGEVLYFNTERAEAHMAERLTGGPCFVVEKITGDKREVIALVTTNRIDVVWRTLDSVETSHTFVATAHRSFKVFRYVMTELKKYADENGLVIIFHQIAYLEALVGDLGSAKRMPDLYTFLGLKQVGGARAIYPAYLEVGNTFLYEGRKPAVPGTVPRGVRLARKAGKPDTGDAGNGGA